MASYGVIWKQKTKEGKMIAHIDLFKNSRKNYREERLLCFILVFLTAAVLVFMPFVACGGDYDQTIERELYEGHLMGPPFGPGIRHLIQGISVSNEQIVLGPGGVSINSCNGCDLESLSDEHSTIFPPGTFQRHPHDYLLFAAPKGVIVLTGGVGPDSKGQWTLDYARDYGRWWPNNPPGSKNGAVFKKAGAHIHCPEAPQHDATKQDPTFDLNYALPGSLVIDPTIEKNAEPGNLLMIYEGTNRCMGTADYHQPGNFYATIGIATSDDDGHTWPAYVTGFTPFTQEEPDPPYSGPRAPDGAWGSQVCKGGLVCHPEPASNSTYGRYAVLSEPVTVSDVMADARNFDRDYTEHGVGDAAPNAFVDTAHSEHGTYLYVIFMGDPGFNLEGCLSVSYPGTERGLTIARARLNGGKDRLEFMKWYGPHVAYGNPAGSFELTHSMPLPDPNRPLHCPTDVAIRRTNAGLGKDGGGLGSPIFPLDPKGAPGTESFKHCLATGQSQTDPQISYVPATAEYLLTFVCTSPRDPLHPHQPLSTPEGAAWFYSTIDATRYNLSHQDEWSTPEQIVGSWGEISTDRNYNGWYPSFMSLKFPSGMLGTSGYVFYLNGPVNSPNNRQYTTRQFTITTIPVKRNSHVLLRDDYDCDTHGHGHLERGF
jgi:hypothetical protein